ncbi:hypothetical protein LCGC14_0787940 [marine sediment metagenome]|uniref:Uncharacterized protein n=1 Tax=marine sediment metagenome TaxID=412755 RepID=A0A0F9PXP4_9ZZZZ
MKEKCENCRYWVDTDNPGDKILGACVRFPPIFGMGGGAAFCEQAMWPATKPGHWCGEWKLRDS